MNWHIKKAVPQKASFCCLSEYISFVTVSYIGQRNIPLQISGKLCEQTDQRKEMCNSVNCIHTSKSSSAERYFSVFVWRYFFSHCSRQCAPKYHLGDSTRRVLANSYMNRKVELCEMNSEIRKTFLRNLLSRFYLGIFSFAAYSSKGSEISVLRFNKNWTSKQLHEIQL